MAKVKKMDDWPTVEAANRAVGTGGLFLFAATSVYLVWQFKRFFGNK